MNIGSARGASVTAPIVGAPIVQAAPTPADKPTTPGTPPASNRFAELLRRNRAEGPRPAAPEPTPTARSDAADRGEAGDTSSIEAKAAPANAAKARAATPKIAAEKASGEDRELGSDKSDAVCGDDSSDAADRIERPASPMSPADRLEPRPAAALAIDTLRRIAAASPDGSDDATGSGAEERDASTAIGTATAYGRGHARGMASIDAANDPGTSPADATRDIALRATADARVQLASDDIVPRASDSPATTTAHDRGIDALTASLGVGAASPGADPAAATASAPAPALATPVDSPDFASALGVRVSVLVQDGVQQAELHLNPAETGPVSIHISLDGTAARVDFGADLASTRAAIERGLPELASALRDAGFTLAGGGVSQHAGGRASGDDDTGRSTARLDGGGNSTSTPVAADSRRVVRTVSAGGVDLYA
jgi:flagellar hook-length control protein FliK